MADRLREQLSLLGDDETPSARGLAGASPVRRQYLEFKRRHPDAILFFRLGDFFETFDDDARLVSETLDITLTGRDLGRGVRVITPGTLVEPTLLAAEANNYLAAVWREPRAAGLAYVDISTGQLAATVLTGESA